MAHLDEHNILVDYQHGFRRNRSCETQLINTLAHLAWSVNYGYQTNLLILDFSKAFDCVAHRRLLLKLDYYGIRGQTLDWLQAWLLNTLWIEHKWPLRAIIALNPRFYQESPREQSLSPCFSLYVNDMGSKISSNLKLLADDMLLYAVIHNQTDALSLQSDLDKLVAWSQIWQMNFHPQDWDEQWPRKDAFRERPQNFHFSPALYGRNLAETNRKKKISFIILGRIVVTSSPNARKQEIKKRKLFVNQPRGWREPAVSVRNVWDLRREAASDPD